MASSLGEQIKAVKRELGFRGRVYPRFVSEGKMSSTKADFEISVMKDVLATLEKLQEEREPSLSLGG